MYLMKTGCADCGGKCGLGCCAGMCGGLGLFDSMDFTTWSWPEWLTIAVGAYVLFSVVSTTKRGTKTIKRKLRRRSYSATTQQWKPRRGGSTYSAKTGEWSAA